MTSYGGRETPDALRATWNREFPRGGVRGAFVALVRENVRGAEYEVRDMSTNLVALGFMSEADGDAARRDLGIG